MKILILIAGTLFVVSGVAQLWLTLQMYRAGKAWRGVGLIGVALTVFGGLTLLGYVFNGTVTGAVLVWILAAALFAGWWQSRRERARSNP